MDYFYGDSITGDHVQMGAAAMLYPWLYEMLRGAPPPKVKALAGSKACDQASAICSSVLGGADRAFYMIGLNDRLYYGNNAGGLALFDSILRAQATFSTHSVLACRQTGWTYSGTWSSAWSPFGIPDTVQTTQNGATASVQFSGDSFDLGYVQIDTNLSSFSMAVDGVPVGAQSCLPAARIKNAPAVGFAPGVVRKSGFGPGTHTLVVTANVSSAMPVSLSWLAQGANGSSFNFLSVPKSVPVDLAADAYNAQMAATAVALAAQGFDVHLHDTASVVDPAIDLSPLDPHPANQGHMNMAGFLKASV